ncbi:MAG: hypothetical protein KDD14_21240 [Saprospiraceae bacterium]|nr:hypothetical protein [Saprospiraceae bacterium]
MNQWLKISHLLLCIVLSQIYSHSQNIGSILFVTDKECDFSIDGTSMGKALPNQPKKYDLAEGEHYLQCITLEKVEKSQIVTVESQKQKVIKLSFSMSPVHSTAAGEKRKIEPITVASLNFQIPGQVLNVLTAAAGNEKGVDLPTFYYAFEEGDEVLLDCRLENEKGSINLEVRTEPENLPVYSNMDFKMITNGIFKVNKRSIYKFIFSTSSGWDRKGQLSIKRVPSDETKINFNTTAIKKKKYKAISIHEPSAFYLNSTSNEDFKGGKSRIVIPVNLPQNTVEWYYVISSTRNEAEIKASMKQFQLLGDINKAIAGLNPTTTALNIAMNLITQPPGADYCDVYLMDYYNQGNFLAKQQFKYTIQGSREHITSASAKINCCNQGQWYLAIQNPDTWYGIHVGVEVVAIVADEGYELE